MKTIIGFHRPTLTIHAVPPPAPKPTSPGLYIVIAPRVRR